MAEGLGPHPEDLLFHQAGATSICINLEVIPLNGGCFGAIVGVRREGVNPEGDGGACIHGVVGVDWHFISIS